MRLHFDQQLPLFHKVPFPDIDSGNPFRKFGTDINFGSLQPAIAVGITGILQDQITAAAADSRNNDGGDSDQRCNKNNFFHNLSIDSCKSI